MSRNAPLREQPATVTRIEARHEDARQFAAEQARGSAWQSLPGSQSIGFMELRGCMCRWPINDAKHPGAIRYCGAACSAEVSYCDTHRNIAVSAYVARSRA